MGSGMGRGRPEAFRGFREKCINVVYIIVLVYLKSKTQNIGISARLYI